MEYTEEQLTKIQEYAALLTTVTDIAVLLDLDEDELRMDIIDKTNIVSKTYHKAKATVLLEFRRQEIDLAKLGSTIAIEQVHKYCNEQQISENG